ncbi:probable aspartic protease At2g35615 isoform X2 [Cajanus cajan]|uniref:probable aspartic protease At2g35615 isoform X2 n=1 Tax=Cajanus cajan TaxID=3821 RepID=UPI0010FB6144|nr:probable aspartic protease At2g35615 isoform X2 [Cajanus cajan]
MRAHFVLCFLVLCSLSTTHFTEATKSGFSVDLIHRDSPLSPLYDPSLTPLERIKNAAMRSMARSNRVSLTRNENNLPKTITVPDIGIGEYLTRFYIGTPPVERFAIADTGSDLIWVQCTPCRKCLPQNTPLFDPTKSSTYRRVRCDSQPCTLLPQNQRRCGKSGLCNYRYIYGDSSYNVGILSVDKISFGSKGVNVFPKFTFGCAYLNKDDEDKTKMNTGLVGLGAGPLSLVSQLGDIGKKFSYCLVPQGSNTTSKLKFGNELATIKGKRVVSTPLIFNSSSPGFYFLNLEGISIGKKMLKTTKSVIDGNMIIDSGTTFTILQKSFYKKFASLVEEVLGSEAVKNPPRPYNLCFKGEDIKDSDGSDDDGVVFHFTGAKVRLNNVNLFSLMDDNLFCVMVKPTDDDDGLPIFGNQAQIGFQVEYDLDGANSARG